MVEGLSTAIQKPSASLQVILEAAVSVKTSLIARSNDSAAFEEVWSEMQRHLQEEKLFPPEQPRKRTVPKRYDMENPAHFATAKEKYWKLYQNTFKNLCYAFIYTDGAILRVWWTLDGPRNVWKRFNTIRKKNFEAVSDILRPHFLSYNEHLCHLGGWSSSRERITYAN